VLGGALVLALAFASCSFAAVERHASATRVTVTFSDTAFGVSPSTLEAGPTTFVVVNEGRKHHALEITGPGLKNPRTPKLVAGESATLTVTLRPGAYMLSDPVGLNAYDVEYLDVVPAAQVSSTGSSSVAETSTTSNAMCGAQYLNP